MTTLTDFIGLPFVDHGRALGCDCWGGVRMVLHELAGVSLPDYGDRYTDVGDADGIESAIRDGLARDWYPVTGGPQMFDLVIFNVLGRPRHVGLMIGPSKFLHWPEGKTSRIESVNDLCWARRVEGFYRYYTN